MAHNDPKGYPNIKHKLWEDPSLSREIDTLNAKMRRIEMLKRAERSKERFEIRQKQKIDKSDGMNDYMNRRSQENLKRK